MSLLKKEEYFKKVTGPFLQKAGRIGGTGLFIETQILGGFGTKEENETFSKLMDENPIKAKEYLLKTTGAYDTWKEKIKELIETQKKLEEQTKELTKKEASIEETYQKIIDTIKKTKAIQKKEENYYDDLSSIIINNAKEEQEKMRIIKNELETIRKNIIRGLEELEKEFPFFFKEKEIRKAA